MKPKKDNTQQQQHASNNASQQQQQGAAGGMEYGSDGDGGGVEAMYEAQPRGLLEVCLAFAWLVVTSLHTQCIYK